MASDPLIADLQDSVAAGESLRTHLLDILRRTGRYEHGAATTELVMFYGQAFRQVQRALSTRTVLGSAPEAVLHEAIRGMAIHRLWMLSNTSLDAPEQLGKMAGHWERIVGVVLGE